jgi:hypothetical protein
MERESFIFYSSWVDAIRKLPLENQMHLCNVIFDYALNETPPGILPDIEELVF